MTPQLPDTLKSVFDENSAGLYLNLRGEDRPNLIAQVTRLLDHERLYIATMTFNLMVSRYEFAGSGLVPYEMDILAKGDPQALQRVDSQIHAGKFLNQELLDSHRLPTLALATTRMFHLAVQTPDHPGIIAQLSEAVGRVRRFEDRETSGSFVHLIANTHNDGGPQGGTPYFNLRANIAAISLEIKEAIIGDLKKTAEQEGFGRDLWTCTLDHPA